MKFLHDTWLFLQQLFLQQISEELVIAIPVPIIVKRNNEQIRTFQII